ADQVGLAEKTAVLLTKDGDQHNTLHDMQCIWKMTLRAYEEMLKLQDRLHSHPYSHKAAVGSIRCYIQSGGSGVSKSGKRQPAKAVDLDPHGAKLLQVKDPLLEATKYLKLLQANSAESMETHIPIMGAF
ncbi:hypothetical protein GIB67_003443, partial [Kingdonia uniflora]